MTLAIAADGESSDRTEGFPLTLHVPPSYAERVRPLLERNPEPPREFSTSECIRDQYGQSLIRQGVFVGLGMLGLAAAYVFRVDDVTSTLVSIACLAIVIVGAALYMLVGVLLGTGYARAIRKGRLVTAHAHQLEDGSWVLTVPHRRRRYETAFDPNPEWEFAVR